MKLTFLFAICLSAGLSMAPAQPVITTHPQDQTVPLNARATFTVEANGTEPLTYQWRRYVNFSTFTDIPGATEATLVVENVEPTSDRFRVIVSNSEGDTFSNFARLFVIPPPSITTQPLTQVGEPGATAVFNVTADGGQPLRYQWRFNGLNLPNATNDNLTLANLKLEQAGSYSVVITNISGSVTSQAGGLMLSATVNPPFAPGLSIRPEQDQLFIEWEGEGLLQKADAPNGPWTLIDTPDSSYTATPAEPRSPSQGQPLNIKFHRNLHKPQFPIMNQCLTFKGCPCGIYSPGQLCSQTTRQSIPTIPGTSEWKLPTFGIHPPLRYRLHQSSPANWIRSTINFGR